MRSVLIIEDNQVDMAIFAKFLENLNLKVFKAYSLEEAFSFLNKQDIEVICLDLSMGSQHGFDFLDQRALSQEIRSIPVIVLTGHADSQTIKIALSKGADHYLIKPIQYPLFEEQLQTLGVICD